MTVRSDLVGMPERLGKYRIERLLGTGAFASVYLGVDDALDSRVAIKVLADNWSHDDDIRRRFIEEARILRRADDERIVRVHTVDELEDGRPYFVMDHADRGTVHQRLHEDGFTVGEAVHVARQIALALDVIHAMGYVHRDVKPTNVLFRSPPAHRRSGTAESVLLGDLGLAKASAAGDGVTVVGGTPAYMAPEQAVSGAVLDGRADLYSLGVVLYEMLTGARPSPVKTLEDAREQLGQVPVRPSDRRGPLPEALDRVVLAMLEPDVSKRPPTAAAVADALDEVLRGLDTSPPRVVADASVHDDPTVTSGATPAAGMAAAAAAAGPAVAAPPGATVIEPARAGAAWARRRGVVGGVVAAVLAVGGLAFALGGGDGDDTGATTPAAAVADTTTSTAPSTTAAPTTVAPTTVPPTTAAPTTVPPTTEAPPVTEAPAPVTPRVTQAPAPTAPPVTEAPAPPAPPAPTAALSGPTSLVRGQLGTWVPTTNNAVTGRWSWANAGCPVTISSPDWRPGGVFQASFNVQATCTLVLAVYNEAGELATARITFTVV